MSGSGRACVPRVAASQGGSNSSNPEIDQSNETSGTNGSATNTTHSSHAAINTSRQSRAFSGEDKWRDLYLAFFDNKFQTQEAGEKPTIKQFWKTTRTRKKKDGDNVEDGLDVDGLRWEDVEDLQLKYLSENGAPLDDDKAYKQVRIWDRRRSIANEKKKKFEDLTIAIFLAISVLEKRFPLMPEFGPNFDLDYTEFYISVYIGGFLNESKESIERMATGSCQAPP
ncbi:hypothetical protein LguiA_009458 [Lonicera macranthoides]